MYFKLTTAKLASDWTLWKTVFGQWWGHVYGHSFCQLFWEHGRLLWWAPWKTRMWQHKVSLVILEADPDMAGALSSCLMLHIKPMLVSAHSWEKHWWHQGPWQLNSPVRNIVLLTVLRQPVSGKPGAGEPSCSCCCSPMDMGHMLLWALGTGEVGWRDIVANRAEGPSLCPCSSGFADECVHPTHDHLCGHSPGAGSP